MFLSPKVLGIDTKPPQTVCLYVSQGLFPTKGAFTEWQDPVHDEEYNELKDPATGLMLHLPNQKNSKNNEVNCNYYENKNYGTHYHPEHPMFIMQYNLKDNTKFMDKYMNAFCKYKS